MYYRVFLGKRALLSATSHLKCPLGRGRQSAVTSSICAHTFDQKPRCQSRRPYSQDLTTVVSRDGKGEDEPNKSRGFDGWLSNILKGVAAILLTQAVFKEVAVPWYKAYQRKESPTASKPKEIATSSSRKFTSNFSSALQVTTISTPVTPSSITF